VYFAYDEAGHLVGEYNINGGTVTTVQETVWLGDTAVATLRTGGGSAGVLSVAGVSIQAAQKSHRKRQALTARRLHRGYSPRIAGSLRFDRP
jgi:hypothetical protein